MKLFMIHHHLLFIIPRYFLALLSALKTLSIEVCIDEFRHRTESNAMNMQIALFQGDQQI
jgi:hypothetical protein